LNPILYCLLILTRVCILALRTTFLESIEESIDEREEIEKEKEKTPMHIRMMHMILPSTLIKSYNYLSPVVRPEMSPNPTVVIVVSVKYIDATYCSVEVES
jgi:hypothetical protein